MEKIVLDSYGKINLALDVLYKRDDGYHELNTLMQSISLKDVLTFESLEDEDVLIIDSNCPDLPLDEGNLVYKAWKILRDRYGVRDGLSIFIDKRIPIGGGLGGGSANAATCLKALNDLWDLGLSLEELIYIGRDIGADVPFCLMEGTAQAQGIGEVLTPLDSFAGRMVLICNPDIEISSRCAYGLLDLDEARIDMDQLILDMKAGNLDKMALNIENKMEKAIFREYPLIEKIKARMIFLGANLSLMSGAGSSVFGIFDDLEKLEIAYGELKKDFDRVYICKTI